MRRAFLLSCLAGSLGVGCAGSPRVPIRVPPEELAVLKSGKGDGKAPDSRGQDGRWTVVVFSSWHCPCQSAHDARLNALVARFAGRAVDFVAVDSEVGGTAAALLAEARKRGYTFPVLLDPGAKLAHTLKAEYATETFVVDPAGVVRYHGGIDDDRTRLHEDATPHLARALDALLAGSLPPETETKALGCALQTW